MFFLSPHFTLLLSVSTSDLSLYSFFFSVHLCFQQVRANLARLRSCVEELRSIPGEGCIRGAARGGELLRQAVLDSLQQFKQYIRHTCTGNQSGNNTSVEVSRDRTFICTTSTTIFFFAWSSLLFKTCSFCGLAPGNFVSVDGCPIIKYPCGLPLDLQ